MWWIPRGFCILESKSLKASCNGLGLEDFLSRLFADDTSCGLFKSGYNAVEKCYWSWFEWNGHMIKKKGAYVI
jgi:hypothetical protein